MEDPWNNFEQTIIDEISETRNFVSGELKVINEKIESLKIWNAQNEEGMCSTREMEDLLKKLKHNSIFIDDLFSRKLKVIKEKIKSFKEEVEKEESMFQTKAMEDLLKKVVQNVVIEISQTRLFASRELKVINEQIEKLKTKKAETYLGMELSDHYFQESLIGVGSMGCVYRVRDLRTGKVCAMKSISLAENRFTPEAAREISTLFDVEHDNIIRLEKVHSFQGFLCLIMEYAGDNLGIVIRKGGKINGNMAKAWLKALLSAIYLLHERDLIHCNLKLDNILIDSSLKLKIAGFGSVRSIFDDTMLSPVPSIPFRAPELLLGFNGYGKPIDIWAVGCIFAEMVEGKSLFGFEYGSDTDFILREIFRKLGTPSQQSWLFSLSNFPNDVHHYPEASEILPNLDVLGNDLIKKMLAVDPLERITAGNALKHPYFKGDAVSAGESGKVKAARKG